MSEVFNPNEQALVAVLAEAKELNIDLAKLAESVKIRLTGNEPNTWGNPAKKQSALEALAKAIKIVE